jgi:pimeloyl-ACP methyl ester carboxylesterase
MMGIRGKDNMQRRSISFFSDGLRLDGELHVPGDLANGEQVPGLITCSGFTGLKDIHPARFARAFVEHGYVCLAFDYRGFGDSEGKQGRLVPQEQVEDVRSAVSFLETVSEVDPDRIALLGWALGGGIAIQTAADDQRVRAVATINAIGDGERSTRSMHDQHSWQKLLGRIAEDRKRRVLEGESELVHPFEVVRLDEVTRDYVESELYKFEGYGSKISLESADYLLRFRPDTLVERIAPRPLLLIHGAENRLHPPSESEELYRGAGEPKELVMLAGSGHTEWAFDEHPTYRRVVDLIRKFFGKSLVECCEGSRPTTP